MKKFFDFFKDVTKFEWFLWIGSLLLISLSFVISGILYEFNLNNVLNLIGSLIGSTALIFMAKGKVQGQCLMLVFCLFYGYVSFIFKYYGEMLTYVLMSLPATITAIITWSKNRTGKRRGEVKVAKLTLKKILIISVITAVTTTAFYSILRYFNTANLVVSTISIATSCVAATLSISRSPFFAIGYALNDIVLIILWSMASAVDLSYLPMVICFVAFLFNDSYSFYSWAKRGKAQASIVAETTTPQN